MKKTKWKVISIGVIASMLLATSMTFASEPSGTTTTTNSATKIQKMKNMELGGNRKMPKEMTEQFKNMTPEQIKEFHLSRLKTKLDQDVADGKLTQEKANEMYQKAVNGECPTDMGKSMKKHKFGEIREEFKNMTPEQIKELRLTHLKEKLTQAVANGKLTQEKADEMYQKAVNGEFPQGMGKGMNGQRMWSNDK